MLFWFLENKILDLSRNFIVVTLSSLPIADPKLEASISVWVDFLHLSNPSNRMKQPLWFMIPPVMLWFFQNTLNFSRVGIQEKDMRRQAHILAVFGENQAIFGRRWWMPRGIISFALRNKNNTLCVYVCVIIFRFIFPSRTLSAFHLWISHISPTVSTYK